MLNDIFPTRIYKTNIKLSPESCNSMRDMLWDLFKKVSNNHILEANGGKSTHEINRELFKYAEFFDLCQTIKIHATHYWGNLEFDPILFPEIVSMWANLHPPKSHTLLHSHTTHVMVGCYYLNFPKNSGNIVFHNPLEYHTHYYPYSEQGKEKDLYKTLKIEEGDLILFPAHLKHFTEINRSNDHRISINFNFDTRAKEI